MRRPWLPLLGVALLAWSSLAGAETTAQRIAALSRDPAHGGRVTEGSRREAFVGLTLETSGRLRGPIRREQSGRSEFIDRNGVRWDVKAFDSRWPVQQGGFLLERAVAKIGGELRAGENVILDTRRLSVEHRLALAAEVQRLGWSNRVIWFPK